MIDKKISEFIEKEKIEKIARETKLVMRKSTISGFDLLITFTAGLLNSPESTLSKLSLFLKSLSQKSFSYQALDKRITMKLVDFLRIIFEEIIKRGSDTNIKKSDFLKRFSNIFIIDSTNFDLHKDLSDDYKGSGGSASSASMRIQAIYEYFSGKFKIKLGDLGYYSIDTFKMIDEADMYFISKIRRNTILRKTNGKLIDLNKLIKKGKTYIDTIVIMKGKKFRLVGGLLPEKQW